MASIFTRIINRELPAEILYETAHTIAILDIAPEEEGHALVVPKEEVADYHRLSAEHVTDLALSIQRVAEAVGQAMETSHYNLMLNNGTAAGQIVFHAHFHVIPKHADAPRRGRGPYPEGRMAEVATRIRQALES